MYPFCFDCKLFMKTKYDENGRAIHGVTVWGEDGKTCYNGDAFQCDGCMAIVISSFGEGLRRDKTTADERTQERQFSKIY